MTRSVDSECVGKVTEPRERKLPARPTSWVDRKATPTRRDDQVRSSRPTPSTRRSDARSEAMGLRGRMRQSRTSESVGALGGMTARGHPAQRNDRRWRGLAEMAPVPYCDADRQL